MAWETATAERPELEPAVALQRRLVGRQIDLLSAFESGGIPALKLPARYVQAKLKRGVAVLAGEPVPLPLPLLTLALQDACDALAATTLAGEVEAITAALAARQIDAGALFAAVFARDQGAVRAMARGAGVAHELVWLAADNALAPFAHLMMRRIAGNETWAGWERGRCPACSTWPVAAEIVTGGPFLRCAFCAAAWLMVSGRCVYCGVEDERWMEVAPNPDRAGRRVMICTNCKGYLKVLETPAVQPFPLPTIADLATFDLDQVAIARGCRKPPL